MKLKNLIKNCPNEYADIEISGICHNADQAEKGSLFFCLVGKTVDGHDYASTAVRNGAAAVVCCNDVDMYCPVIKAADTRAAFAYAACAFYGFPARKLKMFGITGTNGKTTTSYVLAEILRESGEEVGLIGTNCIRYCGITHPATLTTPDPVELNATLKKMRDSGVTAVVMEVSAHALALNKLNGITFDVAGFTNLSRDHLDYFGNMQEYADAKKRLFSPQLCRAAAINADDSLGQDMIRSAEIPTLGYGALNPADVFGIDLKMSAEGLTYVINVTDDIGEVKFSLPGRFNMYNTLCAAAMASLGGINLGCILRGIRSVKRVDGRYNVINGSKFSVIIDFAHTDDGLWNIITSVREFAPKRVITVFGCGGNRDKSKRAVMGKVASQLSDITVITSDNPRYEQPADIIADCYEGVEASKRHTVFTEADRCKAIELAFGLADYGDIVIVAGKGAEQYQEINGVKYKYNDEEYVMSLLQSESEK